MATITPPLPREKSDTQTRVQPPYNVVLLDDDFHTFEYVIGMLQKLFGHPMEKGAQMAKEVHEQGRVIVLTTSKEHAELKQEQIHAFGPDKMLPGSKGSMSCEIEPAV